MRTWMVNYRGEASQASIAAAIGCVHSYYHALENGMRGNKMSIDLMCKLAEAYNVPLERVVTSEKAYQDKKKQKGGIQYEHARAPD